MLKKRGQIEVFCEVISNELFEIKMHLCNERYFEGGVSLGALLSSVMNRQLQEEIERSKNEEVQGEECDEECEESSEEEDEDEDEDEQVNYYADYLREKNSRIETEKSLEELVKKNKELKEANDSIKATKKAIFDLQDILMRLLKFKKIADEEVNNVLSILRNTGVEKGDIEVICKGRINK